MIVMATIAMFGLLVIGMLLEHLHDAVRRVEDRERAADRHQRLMAELRRHPKVDHGDQPWAPDPTNQR